MGGSGACPVLAKCCLWSRALGHKCAWGPDLRGRKGLAPREGVCGSLLRYGHREPTLPGASEVQPSRRD